MAGSVAAATTAPTKARTKPRRVPAKNGLIRRSRSPSLRPATSLARLGGASPATCAAPGGSGSGMDVATGGSPEVSAARPTVADGSTLAGNVMQGTPGAGADSA